MHAITQDLQDRILPSWVGIVPTNWGTTQRGKLTAHQWRILFTIHIPITLIWLWQDETGRKRDLLNNMIHLLKAIIYASGKTTTPELAAAYDAEYKAYMKGVAELFKENTITPNQHCAFHIGQNLRDFGPGHSRGAQWYERYIHLLQSTNTNMKSGI